MAAYRWLGLPTSVASVALAAFGFASCSSEATTTGTGGAASTVTGTGGAGGAVTTTTTTTGAGGDAGPAAPTCKNKSYSNVPKGDCDLFLQDCPPSKTCKAIASGASFTTKCLTSYGLKQEGESCYSDDECLAKLQCIGDHCSPVCCNSNVPCASGRCGLQVSLDPAMKFFVQACIYLTACELFTPDACAAGFNCQVDPVQQLPACIQPSGSPQPELAPCTFLNDCGNMQQCIFPGGGGKGVCHYLCYLQSMFPEAAGEGGCPAGEACQNHDGATGLPFDLPNIGICVPTNAAPDGGP